ncbi:MAG TPA: nuclear transport factor 2 family protein [Bacteroidota bacterium]|nr:nuclear transport factor 2 family protein [Bacteroidota bacterium]
MSNPNITTINKFFAAYGKHDLTAIREVMSDDVTWFFPGNHPLSGTKKGIEEVVAFFDLMADGMKQSFARAEQLVVGGNDDYVVEAQHIRTTVDGITSEHHWCVLWKFENGKIIEGKHFVAE